MESVRLSTLAQWLEVPVPPGLDPNLEIRGISTDSRTLKPGELFVALRGERFDGHDHLDDALGRGAVALLVQDRDRSAPHAGISLLVEETRSAYGRIAAGYRTTLPARVVGVTGSVGKTSTRDLVAAAAGSRRVLRTEGNLNNEIGLPATLLAADRGQDVVVLEMGMRGRGEIAWLSRIARPDVAVITRIGSSHIERLGSLDAIFEAKWEILEGLQDGGTLVVSMDDPLLSRAARRLAAAGGRTPDGRHVSLVGVRTENAGSDWEDFPVLRAHEIRPRDGGVSFLVVVPGEEPLPAWVPLPSPHLVPNALAALAVAIRLGVDPAAAVAGLAAYVPTGNRLRVLPVGDMTLLDDSYNASPESMVAAFAALAALPSPGRRIAALGGMLELGEFSGPLHRVTGAAAAARSIDRLYCCGPWAEEMAQGFREALLEAGRPGDAMAFPDRGSLESALLPDLRPDDAILVKGSRGFAMEEVVAAIVASALGTAP